MARLGFTFRGEPVNRPSNDNLYAELNRYLNSRGQTSRHESRNAQNFIETIENEARQSGTPITGYRRINYTSNPIQDRGSGTRNTGYVDVPIFGQAQQAAPEPAAEPAPVATPEPGFTPTPLDTGATPMGPGSQGPGSQGPASQGPDPAVQFANQITAMQGAFAQSMQQQQQQYQQMQNEQNMRMEALQQQMQQAMVAQQQRPQVAGVQMASGSAGTPMQIARRGVSGAFGRRGIRIQGLNIR